MKNRIRSMLSKFKRNSIEKQLTSIEIRKKFSRIDREIGMYSYGCFDEGRIARRVKIGRYCSFADTARIYTKNHGMSYISTTPYLYEPWLGMEEARDYERIPCVIEDDVWVGHNAIILPGARFIGRGAVIGAGAVVTKPVERYAIVGGNPARKIRDRFPPQVCEKIEQSQWWTLGLDELREKMKTDREFIFSPEAFFSRQNAE